MTRPRDLLKKEWVELSSLKKLQNGEEARVMWPSEANSQNIAWRYGWIEVATHNPVPQLPEDVRPPKPYRGRVFFVWERGELEKQSPRDLGRIEIENPRQVEVKRAVSRESGTRRLG